MDTVIPIEAQNCHVQGISFSAPFHRTTAELTCSPKAIPVAASSALHVCPRQVAVCSRKLGVMHKHSTSEVAHPLPAAAVPMHCKTLWTMGGEL